MAKKMETKPKKPYRVNPYSLRKSFKKYKDDLVVQGKVASSRNPIWSALSAESRLAPANLYRKATSKSLGFREIILKQEPIDAVDDDFESEAFEPVDDKKNVFDSIVGRACRVNVERLNLRGNTRINKWGNVELISEDRLKNGRLKRKNRKTGKSYSFDL